MSNSCVIVSGGSINDSFAMEMIETLNPNYIIGVDSGLNFLYRNHIMPTHIVGDFDSVDEEVIAFYKGQVQIPIREFNPVKDATDTEIALRLSLELGSEKVWMLGATGTRLDHVWANVQILRIAHEANVEAYILDECNRISLWKNKIELKKAEAFGTYFSIFPFDGDVEDVCIVGAKYPLEHFRVTANESRCVSNEVIEDVTITFSDGLLILMETRDKK